ncbi:MAG: hypothetical protein ACSLE6_11085 [Mycobacterium sp.]
MPPSDETTGTSDEVADDTGAAADDQLDGDGDKGGNNEAAKYRRRLRDTEKQRDALLTRVEHLQRAEIERLVADKFRDPADLWRDGAQLAELLDDDGHIDPKKVDTVASNVLAAHEHWGPQPSPPRYNGPRSGAGSPPTPATSSFARAFAPRER